MRKKIVKNLSFYNNRFLQKNIKLKHVISY